ncbi:MAG: hypothetical protein KAJ10_16325, partial [Thermodesulfovibrionia bacterium]|nr:hypothetical protein [Thermodesulfovibrionia bacterium]
MMKKAWMTSLVSSEDIVKKLISQMKTYGVEINGHFWKDDLEKMAWAGAREELIKPDVSLWLILASGKDLDSPSIRYGLSLLLMTVQADKGLSFPVMFLISEGDTPDGETLPTPLKGVEFQSLSDPGIGAKLVAKIHTPVKETGPEYRLDVLGNEQIGQWFEVGPNNDKWSGAMFGIDEGEITFHGVGPKGNLPSESVLNYASKGLKLQMGDKEYTAWAVR